MIPTIHFSWQAFRPLIVRNIKVGDLYGWAQKRAPTLFVLHDTTHRVSALVIPDLVMQTVKSLALPEHERAVAVGLLDLIRQDQITVHMKQPAGLVARLAAWREAHAVIVINDKAIPVGLFIPSVVAQRLPETSQIMYHSSADLQKTVRRLAKDGDVARALTAIEKEHKKFHSERLNQHGPDPCVCQDQGKSHLVSFCPCDRHPNAPCGREGVASR